MTNSLENSEKIYTFFGEKDYTIYLEEFIPQYIKLNYPNFVEFVNVYLKYLTAGMNAHMFINNIISNINVDEITCPVLNSVYESQFLGELRPYSIVNKTTIIKYIKQFYESVGSEKSFKFIFKLIYNEDINIQYPWNSVLRTSAGNWGTDRSIKVQNTENDTTILKLEAGLLIGKSSGGTALIERIRFDVTEKGLSYAEIFISEYDPTHPYSLLRLTDDEFECISLDGSYKTTLAKCSSIESYTIENPGILYKENDEIVFTGVTHIDQIYAVVDDVSSGDIDDIEIIEGGSNYVVGDIITALGDGYNLKAKVSEVSETAITKIKILSTGSQYKSLPHLVINSTNGTGAVLLPKTSTVGNIRSLKMIRTGIDISNIDSSHAVLHTSYKIYKPGGNYTLNFSINQHLSNETGTTTARIDRINNQTGIILIEYETGTTFSESDILTLTETSETGFKIHSVGDNSKGLVSFNAGIIGSYTPGYSNFEGFVSGTKVLQDSYFYQKFSYLITTFKNKKYWIDNVKSFCHPAGTIIFGYSDYPVITTVGGQAGTISPTHNYIEWDKFTWSTQSVSNPSAPFTDTHITRYLDYPIYELARFTKEEAQDLLDAGLENVNKTNVVTNFCYGSIITITQD